jgi:NAD(P)H-quinone oxidoreductase subunit 5
MHDPLTATLLALTTFIFAVVCIYSRRYMAGDPGQVRFTIWLFVTGACVFALIIAQNLLLFALAWCGISLSLHQLLQFYQYRPGALLAARKKFLISRLGDASLATALILTYRQFGTWDFKQIAAAAERLRVGGINYLPAQVSVIAGLLVFAALLKSAQFPFHSWLPDTMETPTPVSALMHAGIINAGGILVLRLSPLISLSQTAMRALCLVGAFTALFASLIMLTQASVKRCLAFSTVAQMGFMMLECGLGAFHLALLHIVAHSLYKAHAFLSTGSAVSKVKQSNRYRALSTGLASLLCAIGITAVTALLCGVEPLQQPLLSGIFLLALSQMLWSFWAKIQQFWQIPIGLALGAIFCAVYFALDRAAGLIVKPLNQTPPILAISILALFVLVALMQINLPALSRTTFGAHLYIHARNGFYFNTLANRITATLWPVQTIARSSR